MHYDGSANGDELLNGPRVRNVLGLRVNDLVPTGTRSHKKREPVVIDGVVVPETLKERITRETAELEQALQLMAAQLVKKSAQLEHLRRFPDDDPFVDGTILKFEKSFPANPGRRYSYAAHRVAGYWFLTGERSPQRVTWQQLVNWMGLGVDIVYQLDVRTRSGRRKVIG